MKKLTVSLIFILLFFSIQAFASETAILPECTVTLNGQTVDNTYRQYPLLSYKDIVYFPMTYYDCRFLGVSTIWDGEKNNLDIKTDNITCAYRAYSWQWENSKNNEVNICTFNITVNGNTIDNSTEKYPLLTFRDVTYFPLTWRFAHDEFGWSYSYDETNGLVITSDNYICEELILPDMCTTTVTAPCVTDGKYYYYRGNKGKIYRTPVDDISKNELLYTMPENSPLGMTYQNGNVYFNYHTGGATMGSTHYYKINADGSVEESKEAVLAESGIGYNIRYYKSDTLTVTTVNQGHPDSTQVFYTNSDKEITHRNFGTEIKLDGVRFGEKKNSNTEMLVFGNAAQILGTNIYLTGYSASDSESRLYKVDTLTGEIFPLLENVQEFYAFTGWDTNTNSNSDMFIYVQDGKLLRYSTESSSTYVIEESSMPFETASGDLGLYVVTKDATKSAVKYYDCYGNGSISQTLYETSLPTDFYAENGVLYGRNFEESPIEDVHTVIFNDFPHFFRSSDVVYNIFISDGTLIFNIWDNVNRFIKVDLNKQN